MAGSYCINVWVITINYSVHWVVSVAWMDMKFYKQLAHSCDDWHNECTSYMGRVKVQVNSNSSPSFLMKWIPLTLSPLGLF